MADKYPVETRSRKRSRQEQGQDTYDDHQDNNSHQAVIEELDEQDTIGPRSIRSSASVLSTRDAEESSEPLVQDESQEEIPRRQNISHGDTLRPREQDLFDLNPTMGIGQEHR